MYCVCATLSLSSCHRGVMIAIAVPSVEGRTPSAERTIRLAGGAGTPGADAERGECLSREGGGVRAEGTPSRAPSLRGAPTAVQKRLGARGSRGGCHPGVLSLPKYYRHCHHHHHHRHHHPLNGRPHLSIWLIFT